MARQRVGVIHPKGGDVSDATNWLTGNDEGLQRIAERAEVDADVARAAAALVLAGYTDEEIVDELREHVLVMDGQFSPMRHIPQLLFEVRELVARS